ncbi:hypothetical protein LXL04_001080 [Taraxacum kok-saghyz]
MDVQMRTIIEFENALCHIIHTWLKNNWGNKFKSSSDIVTRHNHLYAFRQFHFPTTKSQSNYADKRI